MGGLSRAIAGTVPRGPGGVWAELRAGGPEGLTALGGREHTGASCPHSQSFSPAGRKSRAATGRSPPGPPSHTLAAPGPHRHAQLHLPPGESLTFAPQARLSAGCRLQAVQTPGASASPAGACAQVNARLRLLTLRCQHLLPGRHGQGPRSRGPGGVRTGRWAPSPGRLRATAPRGGG